MEQKKTRVTIVGSVYAQPGTQFVYMAGQINVSHALLHGSVITLNQAAGMKW